VESAGNCCPDVFVFLGSRGGKEAAAYWRVDVNEVEGARVGESGDGSAFVDLRTLMVVADWREKDTMGWWGSSPSLATYVPFFSCLLTSKIPTYLEIPVRSRI
jgi:hypothetical protein